MDVTIRISPEPPEDDREPVSWGPEPTWKERNTSRPPVEEPPAGTVVRFRINSYRFVAFRVVDDGYRTYQRWYTTAVSPREKEDDFGFVGSIDTWARICEVAQGPIEQATAWQAL